MSFDPEKVERVEADANFGGEGWYQCTVVQAEDYDQLLQLYRKLLDSHGPDGSLGRFAAKHGQTVEV